MNIRFFLRQTKYMAYRSFYCFVAFFFVMLVSNSLKAQTTFNSLENFISYATSRSVNLQSGQIRLDQAKQAKLAALLAIPDINANTFFNYTNNTQIPVTLVPAGAFGGDTGAGGGNNSGFRELQFGVKYNSNWTATAEIKLFNLQGWEGLKLSKMNIEATNSDNKLTNKLLQEDIASIYYNIITLQEQLKATKQNLLVADTLKQIVENKFQQGLVKPQEVNNAKANFLNTSESVKQIEFMISQQYLALKTLCDIPESEGIAINESIDESKIGKVTNIDFNQLSIENNTWKEKRAWSSYQQAKFSQVPTISFVISGTKQQFNPNAGLFDSNVRWIPSSYIGFKLTWALPSANAISQIYKAKYDYRLAVKSTEQAKIKAELNNKQLGVNYEKALSQWQTNKDLYQLNVDSYRKNFNLYQDGLLGLEQTLNSFNAMVNSNYNQISSGIAVMAAQAKIEINNRIK